MFCVQTECASQSWAVYRTMSFEILTGTNTSQICAVSDTFAEDTRGANHLPHSNLNLYKES